MRGQTSFRIAVFCLACGLIGLPAFGGLRSAALERTASPASPMSHEIRRADALPAGVERGSDAAIRPAADLENSGSAQWLEAPIPRRCRPMGHAPVSTRSKRPLPACLTV